MNTAFSYCNIMVRCYASVLSLFSLSVQYKVRGDYMYVYPEEADFFYDNKDEDYDAEAELSMIDR